MTTQVRLITYRLSLMAADAVLSAASFYLAFGLRTDQLPLGSDWTRAFVRVIPIIIAIRLAVLTVFGVYRIMVRHTSVADALLIAKATGLSSAIILIYVRYFHWTGMPNTVIVIDAFVNFLAISGARLGYRTLHEATGGAGVFRIGGGAAPRKRILIIGAGQRGASLAREVRRRVSEGLVLVGFLDDDPAKHHQLIQGAPVLGSTEFAPAILATEKVDEVIIAISSARGPQIREITRRLESVPVRLRISPGFAELEESDLFTNLRDVEVEDLLQRDPVKVDMNEIAAYLTGARVLVTGAGGSIGSELVRQIARLGPECIILVGHGENSVFEVEEEMRRRCAEAEEAAGPAVAGRPWKPIVLMSVIADIRDFERIRRVMDETRPTVVFHAAAHKHVPLMELNPEEAITNNVLGTRNLARAATRVGVRRFVMISTDKAVNPSSMMGASKRVAERVIQLEAKGSTTQFATVRFGNVLGSRGSVVPTMRRQIERGGPVTVTHPDVTRYFMTIPEAVQLVIQAGAMAGTGTIYVLDMGEPVRIMELAHSLIRLSGLVPERDIEVKITGLRPGEKLQEELLTAEEGTTLTKHARIFMAAQTPLPVEDLDKHLDTLIAAAQAGDHRGMLAALAVLAPLYKCGSIVAHLAARSAPAAQAGDARANDSALHQSDTPIAAPTNITGQ